MTEEKYHELMHRAYRSTRAQLALSTSPFSEDFPLAVLERYRGVVRSLRIKQEEVPTVKRAA